MRSLHILVLTVLTVGAYAQGGVDITGYLAQTNLNGVITGQPVNVEPLNSFLGQTNANSVVTGQPSAVTSAAQATNQVTSQASTASTPASTTSVPTTDSSTFRSTTSSTSTIASSSRITTSSSTTTSSSASTTPSPSPSSGGLSQSSKIGIGLGVPLGLIFAAIAGYGLYRYGRNKQNSRARHIENIAAAGLYPAVDNADAGREGPAHEQMDIVPPSLNGGELHGNHIPSYSRELEGSAVPGKEEFP